jgi:hypothetical protein
MSQARNYFHKKQKMMKIKVFKMNNRIKIPLNNKCPNKKILMINKIIKSNKKMRKIKMDYKKFKFEKLKKNYYFCFKKIMFKIIFIYSFFNKNLSKNFLKVCFIPKNKK